MKGDFEVSAYAPASIGNLTVGFDLLGMALQAPGDEVSVRYNNTNEVKIVGIEGDNGKLPLDADTNTASVAIKAFLKALKSDKGVDVFISKKMPLGSGMGSSAASAVAGAMAVNALFGNPFSKKELIPFTLEGEKAASGGIHGDNAIPSLLGGIVLVKSCDPLDIIELPVPEDLHYVLVHPDLQIFTKEARELLPKQLATSVAIRQMGAMAGFISGLYDNNYAQIQSSLVDLIAEPARKGLITGFDECREKAMEAGAIHCGISGSGPSIFALTQSKKMAEKVSCSINSAFNGLNIKTKAYFNVANKVGAHVI